MLSLLTVFETEVMIDCGLCWICNRNERMRWIEACDPSSPQNEQDDAIYEINGISIALIWVCLRTSTGPV